MSTARSKRRRWLAVVAVPVTLLAIAVLFTLVTGLLTWKATPVDMVGLHMNGGPFEGSSFEGVVEPGSGRQFLGLADELVLLPVTQRDYVLSDAVDQNGSAVNDDGEPIVVATRGGAEMSFSIIVHFTLNSGDAALERFYQRVCIKFRCDTEDGWDEMLRVNFRGAIENALQDVARRYTVVELFAGETEEGGGTATDEEALSILSRVQADLAATVKENINDSLGGDFFCGPTFDRSDPDTCPDFDFQITDAAPTDQGIIDSFAQNVASEQAQITAQNHADAQLVEAQGSAQAAIAEAEGQRLSQEALNGIYGVPGYIDYLNAQALQICAANQNCILMVGGDGNVNVNAGTSGGG